MNHPLYNFWTDAEVELLYQMVRDGVTFEDMAAHLPGRAAASIRSKYYALENPRGAASERAYEAPARSPNLDEKHLRLVLAASPGGFPFCVLPAAYRVAA